MNFNYDWENILLQCKNKVIICIAPSLKTLKDPQPDLGKGAGGDIMKLVDLAAESAIIDTLETNNVSFTLISEESGIKEFGSNPQELFVTVDPIDGTTNLMHGLPFYASSIAISRKPEISEVYVAMVADLFHDITYMAFDGRGAYCNGEKIETSSIVSLYEAVVGLDINTGNVKAIESQLTDLIENAGHIRHFGANALELCYVADGSTDAFVDIRAKLRTTDVAASFLIVKEAGGIVTSLENKAINAKLDPKQTVSFVASGNHQMHKHILDLVRA
jgi:myo-inositol-1(or 4)-monophosphatase